MSKDKIEKRQIELQKEAQSLVEERTSLHRKIGGINIRIEQIKGAFTELENQKADLVQSDSPKKESPKKEEKK